MKKIVLCCAAGMSTSILVEQMKKVAKEIHLHVVIEAMPASSLGKRGRDADVILIGPQVRFLEERICEKMAPIPCFVIDLEDYGRMDGKRVLYKAVQILKGNY